MFRFIGNKLCAIRAKSRTNFLLRQARRVRQLSEPLVSISEEAFANHLREIKCPQAEVPPLLAAAVAGAERSLGLSAYDVQIAGAIVLTGRAIAQMQTGEGKTLTAALAAATQAMRGRKVHLATVNDYLAGRDAQKLRPFYESLGLSVGHAAADLDLVGKQAAYACDVVYATAQELGFDYLRDHLVESRQQCVQGLLDVVILDEADSILIDEAGTPLILSGEAQGDNGLYARLIPAVLSLDEGEHYTVDRKELFLDITEEGYDLVEELLQAEGLLAPGESLHDAQNLSLAHAVTSSLAAQILYRRDIEYMVNNGEIIIVDEHTGRALKGRRWSEGLHQAIEAKEGMEVKAEAPTLATITYQGFLGLYRQLSGLTGTAESEREELSAQYGLAVQIIPTHRPVQRIDEHDRVFASASERDEAVILEVIEARRRGQPVLLGTDSVEASETLAGALRRKGIEPAVLNARYHEQEAAIIAEAGRPAAVTIATQMAGRGTDILLGGNLDAAIDITAVDNRIEAIRMAWERDHQNVIKAGGLYVIGTSRAPSRRVDLQLRGRAGRQGDPGRTCFFLSLEDEFVRVFAGDKLTGIMQRLDVIEGEALEGRMMDRIIEQAQATRERVDRQVRKELMKYDNVLANQRSVVYAVREEWLRGLEGQGAESSRALLVERLIQGGVEGMCRRHLPNDPLLANEWDSAPLVLDIARRWNLALPPNFFDHMRQKPEALPDYLLAMAKAYYEHRKGFIDERLLERFERVCIMEGLDKAWQEQQRRLTLLRDGIGLRAYANEIPQIAFQREAGEIFAALFEEAYELGAQTLLGARLPEKQIRAALHA